MFIKREKNNIIYYTSPLFDRHGVNHMFCTRHGGVSSGDFGSLNVSTARKDSYGQCDSPVNVEENYRRALSVLDCTPANSCAAKQVHSDIVTEVTRHDGGKGIIASSPAMSDCDGVILRKSVGNIGAVCVKTADCVPILLADLSSGDVCAVHAGWRGSAADIVSKAAHKLSNGKPENIIAAIGPCIGLCCYEIGDEVYFAFNALFNSKSYGYNTESLFSVAPTCSMGGKRHLGLALANAELLKLCGVREENIDISGICTCCFKDEHGKSVFFSHRGWGGHSGTFLSAVCSAK